MSHERRHFVRVSFDAPAQLTTARDAFTVMVQDLSLKGALVVAPDQAEMAPGGLCQLEIPLADSSARITMAVEVAYVQGPFTGLLCREIDLDSVTHLRRLIELQLGAPELLERDLAELMQGPHHP
jgi:hypothetical protein